MNSVCHIIYNKINENHQWQCLHYLNNGQYEPIRAIDFANRCETMADWLSGVGQPGDSVIIWATNCWQWAVMDIACQLSDRVSVPIYPTAGQDQLTYMFNDTKPTIVCIDHLTVKRLEFLRTIDSIQTIVPIFSVEKRPGDGSVSDYDDIIANSNPTNPLNQENWTKHRLDQPLTKLYTSGTTGTPKAVQLTHNNIVENFNGIKDVIPLGSTDSTLSFLPLSHIFERTVGLFCILGIGGSIYYAESIDTVARDLEIAKPTLVISVPRLYEKIYQKVMKSAVGIKGVIIKLAVKIGQYTKPGNPLWQLAYQLVFKKIHQKTGGNVRFLITGGAPIAKHIELFFNAIGLPVIQGYGLTETSPILTVNQFDNPKVGSIGKALGNVSVKLGEDGELLAKGNSVFSGYLNTDNADTFTSEGYFKTGDYGSIDSNGFIYITGRKKEIIVLSNGKNVAPNVVESELIQSDFINQVMVLGDNRNYLTALIVANSDAIRSTLGSNDDYPALFQSQDVIDLMKREVKLFSTNLASFETVKKFQLLPNEFSIDGGELTPTLKLRRKEINKKYQHLIDSLYDNI